MSGTGLSPAVAAPTGAAPATTPVRTQGTDPSFTFSFTGAPQSLTVPANAVVTITADGAGGADNTGTPCSVTGAGGTGARVVTTLPKTTVPMTFTIDVGGTGGKGCNGNGTGGAGGFNGGAPGGTYPASGFQYEGAGGGGASSVSAGGSLLVVAGGGGAAGGTGASRAGGNGGNGGTSDATGGTAGSATGPGASPGQGGGGGSTSTTTGGAGGAGGSVSFCGVTNGGSGSGFSGAAVGTGGAGGSIGAGCALTIIGAGGGGGGGYFAGGGGGSGAVNNLGTAASGGGGGGGSSFATPSGTGTGYSASTIGTANNNGRVTITYTVGQPVTTFLNAIPRNTRVGRPVVLNDLVCPAGGSTTTPTGTVTFTDTTTQTTLGRPRLLFLSLGRCAAGGLVTAFRTPGTHTITAVYSGDSVYQDNSANPESITVTVSP
ncbi:Ig-like domain repeat protein [Kitasatospora sp. NPDC048298]|uniref:Ig-like domain repeat protein n=1 Tax=Kitasatospora sp. NPDC048298 TaxID=3364049 RepID=UPI0037192FA9